MACPSRSLLSPFPVAFLRSWTFLRFELVYTAVFNFSYILAHLKTNKTKHWVKLDHLSFPPYLKWNFPLAFEVLVINMTKNASDAKAREPIMTENENFPLFVSSLLIFAP